MDLYEKKEKSVSNFEEGSKTLEILVGIYALNNERILQPLPFKN